MELKVVDKQDALNTIQSQDFGIHLMELKASAEHFHR